jgi:hypothetical protein
VLVTATDRGVPPLMADTTSTVTVIVDRNRFAPFFVNPSTYFTTINENIGPGSEILRTEVKDNDTVASLFSYSFK